MHEPGTAIPSMRIRTSPQIALLACLMGGVGVLMLHLTLGLGGARSDGVFDNYVYNALMWGATAAVLARAVTVKAQRAAWLAMGVGLACWSAGELYFTLFLEGPNAPSGVTPADTMYLAMYPCMYVALTLLIGTHLRELRVSMWLDGLIAGLAAASVAAALILPPILKRSHHDALTTAVALAYPIGDILLLLFTVLALGMTGWRPGRVWLLIAASMLLSAIADSTYAYRSAIGTWTPDTWLEGLWPASAALLAVAAWTPWPRAERRHVEDWRLVLVPAVSLLAALGVFVDGNLRGHLTPPALILAITTVLAVCARLMLTVRENLRMLEGSRRLALTDPLTGLGNRRQLMEDLQVACRAAHSGRPWRLVIYDLNGFKLYNDTFGHPAGDALLTRLSANLRTTVSTHGTAYRMGGDEFCVLLDGADPNESELERASVRALSEQGAGYAIGAAHGGVGIPLEARDPSAALALADQRLYERKDRTEIVDPFVAATLHPERPSPAPGQQPARLIAPPAVAAPAAAPAVAQMQSTGVQK
jgi:diguanylate cyclase (GGDEF)-like protein